MGKKILKILLLFAVAIIAVIILDKLSVPIKYLSNGLLALCVAFIVNFFVLKKTSRRKTIKKKEKLEGAKYSCSFENVTVEPVNTFIK